MWTPGAWPIRWPVVTLVHKDSLSAREPRDGQFDGESHSYGDVRGVRT